METIGIYKVVFNRFVVFNSTSSNSIIYGKLRIEDVLILLCPFQGSAGPGDDVFPSKVEPFSAETRTSQKMQSSTGVLAERSRRLIASTTRRDNMSPCFHLVYILSLPIFFLAALWGSNLLHRCTVKFTPLLKTSHKKCGFPSQLLLVYRKVTLICRGVKML